MEFKCTIDVEVYTRPVDSKFQFMDFQSWIFYSQSSNE